MMEVMTMHESDMEYADYEQQCDAEAEAEGQASEGEYIQSLKDEALENIYTELERAGDHEQSFQTTLNNIIDIVNSLETKGIMKDGDIVEQ